MGLDQYVHHIKKASELEAAAMNGRRLEDISSKYPIYYGDEPHLIEDILPWLQKIRVRTDELNYDEIKQAYNIPLNSYVGGWSLSSDKFSMTFVDDDDNRHKVTLTNEEQKQFEHETEIDVYIAHSADEFQYWRKNYELADKLDNVCANENCAHYPVTKEMWDIIQPYTDYDDDDYIPMTEDECLVYHQWY